MKWWWLKTSSNIAPCIFFHVEFAASEHYQNLQEWLLVTPPFPLTFSEVYVLWLILIMITLIYDCLINNIIIHSQKYCLISHTKYREQVLYNKASIRYQEHILQENFNQIYITRLNVLCISTLMYTTLLGTVPPSWSKSLPAVTTIMCPSKRGRWVLCVYIIWDWCQTSN